MSALVRLLSTISWVYKTMYIVVFLLLTVWLTPSRTLKSTNILNRSISILIQYTIPLKRVLHKLFLDKQFRQTTIYRTHKTHRDDNSSTMLVA